MSSENTRVDPRVAAPTSPATTEREKPRMVDPAEVRALIGYVTERGMDSDANITAPLAQAVALMESCENGSELGDKTTEVVRLYGKLTALTYPTERVNGRTVIDSDKFQRSGLTIVGMRMWPETRDALAWLVVAFTCAVLTESMRVYYGTQSVDGLSLGWVQSILDIVWVHDLYRLVLLYLQPFFWGAVGASVYLLRHTAELVEKRRFDSRSSQGVSTRIILGGVFGAVIVHLFFGRVAGSDSSVADLGASAVAFLSGLGIRAIYAAFQRVVDTLADWVGGRGKPDNEKS